MTVFELIELLQDLPEDAEVRFAQQPSYPFEYSISNVVCPDLPEIVRKAAFDEMSEEEQEQVMARADEDEVLLLDEGEDEPQQVVYLGEGSQIGYLPGIVSRELGWR